MQSVQEMAQFTVNNYTRTTAVKEPISQSQSFKFAGQIQSFRKLKAEKGKKAPSNNTF